MRNQGKLRDLPGLWTFRGPTRPDREPASEVSSAKPAIGASGTSAKQHRTRPVHRVKTDGAPSLCAINRDRHPIDWVWEHRIDDLAQFEI